MTLLAFDRSELRGTRWKDEDGRLHIDGCRISKACVNPYRGEEIPDWQSLGLDPNRIYQLLRDPDELAKSVPTWHGIQLMSKHVGVDSKTPELEHIAGTLGTNPRFEAPYLVNDVTIWFKDDVDDVESKEKFQLSCGYYYEADMTPGTYQGLRYDGVMRNIRGNHTALVEAGRVGPDVMVHDERKSYMPLASRKALVVKGALAAYLRPKFQSGTSMLALDSILGSVTAANWKTQKPVVLATVTALATPKLAQDAALTDLPAFLGALDEEEDKEEAEDELKEDKPPGEDEEEDEEEEDKKKAAKDKAARDKKAKDAKRAMDAKKARDAKRGKDKDLEEWAEEEEEEPEHKKGDDKAMDAAIAKATAATEARVIARMTAAAEAREVVRPYVGNVSLALDSAAGIYEFALKAHKIDTAGIHPTALKAMVGMLPKPGQQRQREPLAFDSARNNGGGLDEMFPSGARIRLS